MLVLDTELLTFVQLRIGTAYQPLERRLIEAGRSEVIAVTIVSAEEQMRGWLAQIARARAGQQEITAYHRLKNVLSDYCDREVLDYDAAAVMKFVELKKGKIRIGTMDLKIAAIVLSRGATLLSRNLRDFRKVPGRAVEDWTQP